MMIHVARASEKNRQLARRWRDAFGQGDRGQVCAYYNEGDSLRVDIFEVADAPQRGVSTFASIGVSDYANEVAPGQAVPVELIAVGAAAASDLPARTLATIAFDHIAPGIVLRPGLVVPEAVSRNSATTVLRHVLLTAPFLWDDLGCVETEVMSVYPLLAVPITEAEFRFAEVHGGDALEARLAERQIDIYNWLRTSAI